MKTPNLELPNGVDRADWLTARLELLAKEKDLTRRRDALNAERRRLPMVRIEKDYLFEGPNGKASLLDIRGAPSAHHLPLRRRDSQLRT